MSDIRKDRKKDSMNIREQIMEILYKWERSDHCFDLEYLADQIIALFPTSKSYDSDYLEKQSYKHQKKV
jgi:hypothetical protein